MEQASNKKLRTLIGLVGLAAALAIGGFYVWRMSRPREAKIDGVLASVDPASRTGTLDCIHPKTGQPFKLRGEIPDDCRIELNGQPAGLDALRPGDTTHVEGLLYVFPDQKAVARYISVTRDANDAPSSNDKADSADKALEQAPDG